MKNKKKHVPSEVEVETEEKKNNLQKWKMKKPNAIRSTACKAAISDFYELCVYKEGQVIRVNDDEMLSRYLRLLWV